MWVVDNGARHGGNQDDGSGFVGSHHSLTDGLGHEERAVQVDVNKTAPHLVVVLLSRNVGAAIASVGSSENGMYRFSVCEQLPENSGVKIKYNEIDSDLLGNTSTVNQDIRSSILLSDGSDSLLNSNGITDINWEELDRNLGASGLVKFSGRGNTELWVSIEDDHVLSTCLDASASHHVTETTSGSVNEKSVNIPILKISGLNWVSNIPSDNNRLALDGHFLKAGSHGIVDLLA